MKLLFRAPHGLFQRICKREKMKIFSKLDAYLIKLTGKENKSQLLANRD